MEGFELKLIAGGCAAFLAYCFGSLDIPLQTLLFFLVADFISGTMKAIKLKELSSSKAWDGFRKKIMTLVFVAVAIRIDILMNLDGALRLIAIYGYIGSELYSLVENGLVVGYVPPVLGKYFKSYAKELSGYDKR